MKLYEKPDFAVRMIETKDIITVSGGEQPGGLQPADVVGTTQWDDENWNTVDIS